MVGENSGKPKFVPSYRDVARELGEVRKSAGALTDKLSEAVRSLASEEAKVAELEKQADIRKRYSKFKYDNVLKELHVAKKRSQDLGRERLRLKYENRKWKKVNDGLLKEIYKLRKNGNKNGKAREQEIAKEHIELTNRHRALEIKHQLLEAQHSGFKTGLENYKNEYGSLKGDYEALKNENESIKKDFEVLNYQMQIVSNEALNKGRDVLTEVFEKLDKEHRCLLHNHKLKEALLAKEQSRKELLQQEVLRLSNKIGILEKGKKDEVVIVVPGLEMEFRNLDEKLAMVKERMEIKVETKMEVEVEDEEDLAWARFCQEQEQETLVMENS